MSLIFILLIAFQLKHWLADYVFQGQYMMGKFKPGWDFVLPLLAHVGVHAAFTFAISLFLTPWWLALMLALGDAVIHFFMDRLKAGPKYLGRFKPLTAVEYINARSVMDIGREKSGEKVYVENKRKLLGNRLFWIALGFDAFVHYLTHYGIIYVLVMVKAIINP